MKLTLAAQFTATFLVVVIVTAGAVAYFVEDEAKQFLVEQEQGSIRTQLRAHSAELSSSIENLHRDLHLLSGLPPIRGMVLADENDGVDPRDSSTAEDWQARLRTILSRFQTANEDYAHASYQRFEETFSELVCGGEATAPAQPELEALALKAEHFPMSRPIEGAEVRFSEIADGSATGRHAMIRGSLPIYDSGESLAGAVVLDLDLGSVFGGLFTPYEGAGGILVLDERGRIIGASGVIVPEPILVETLPLIIEALGRNGLASESWGGIASSDGKLSMHAARADFVHSPGRFFVLVSAKPRAALFAAADQLRQRALTISGVLIALGAVLTFILARFLARPISEVTHAARSFGHDGSEVPLPQRATGEVAVLVGAVAKMIGQVKERNAKILSNEAWQRNILTHAADGVITIDCVGKILAFNKKAEEIFGYVEIEVLEQNIKMLMPDEQAGRHDGHLERYHQRHDSPDSPAGSFVRELREVSGRKKDGTLVPLEITISAVEDAGKTCFTGIVRDVSARQLAEEERSQLLSKMEAKNAELERFTYTVSHDLKSPLITIQGFAELLAKDIETGDHSRIGSDLARINEAAKNMYGLLDKLLELSRIGRLVAPSEDVAVADVVETAHRHVEGRLDDGRVEVVVAAELPTVHGDRQRLVEVFQNLIDNAAKFMGGQVTPRIEIGVRYDDDEQVLFVRDNGVGIPEAYQDRVFGLFERLDLNVAGTGVGLALVKRIVELHGGRIWIESDPSGQGTCFCLTLPGQPAELSTA